MKDNCKYALGIDLGGTSIKSVLAETNGTVVHRDNNAFDPGKPMDWAQKVRDVVELHREKNKCSIGLSAPGLAAPDGRSIAVMPGRLHGLERLDWSAYLNCEEMVPVLNDAHAALLGEVWMGAAKNYKSAILLTLGTGVGGAIYLDGKILKGPNGRAGHFGHTSLNAHGPLDITGTPGALEWMIGNYSIGERAYGKYPTTHALVEASRNGDPFARSIWLESVRQLAAGIISFVNILDVEAAIIGGGIARSGPDLFEPLQKFVDQWEWRPGGAKVAIVPAQLGEFAGAIGAAYNGLQHVTSPNLSK